MSKMLEIEFVDKSLVRWALEAAHREYHQGILENEPGQLLAFYEKWTAPDFEERDNPKGHVTSREEMLALMEQVVASGGLGGFAAALEATSTIAELVVEGDHAVAVVTNQYRYRQTDMQGWYGAKGEEHEIETRGRWWETWVKVGENWRFQISQMLSSQTYVDGALYAPTQPE